MAESTDSAVLRRLKRLASQKKHAAGVDVDRILDSVGGGRPIAEVRPSRDTVYQSLRRLKKAGLATSTPGASAGRPGRSASLWKPIDVETVDPLDRILGNDVPAVE